jgi:hypothetical protein
MSITREESELLARVEGDAPMGRRLRFEPLPGGLPSAFGTSAPDAELIWWVA